MNTILQVSVTQQDITHCFRPLRVVFSVKFPAVRFPIKKIVLHLGTIENKIYSMCKSFQRYVILLSEANNALIRKIRWAIGRKMEQILTNWRIIHKILRIQFGAFITLIFLAPSFVIL